MMPAVLKPVARLTVVFFFAAFSLSVAARQAHAELDFVNGCQNATGVSFSSGAVNIPISSSGKPVITSTIVVSTPRTFIADVDMLTFITHTNNDDLDITLTSPAGTTVIVSSDNGGTNDDVFNGTEWDDFAGPVTKKTFTNNVVTTSAGPEGGFAAFQGENPNGTWTLKISDDNSNDGGNLQSWALTFGLCSNTPGRNPARTFSSNEVLNVPDNDAIGVSSGISVLGLGNDICGLTIQTFLEHPLSSQVDMYIETPEGLRIPVTNDFGANAANLFNGTIWRTKLAPPVSDATINAASGAVISPLAPQQSFGALFEENANGVWLLVVRDDAAGGTGTLKGWNISVETCGLDSDSDGIWDEFDRCPADAQKILPGVCGCGVAEVDPDGDGLLSCVDFCPADGLKSHPGVCGCSVLDTDTDLDGLANCLDLCPSDPAKRQGGICGCGVADADLNKNGFLDCNFNREFRELVLQAQSALAALKPGNVTAQKKRIKTLASAMSALSAFLAKPGVAVIGTSGTPINALHTGAQSAVAKALVKLLAADLKKAASSLKKLAANL